MINSCKYCDTEEIAQINDIDDIDQICEFCEISEYIEIIKDDNTDHELKTIFGVNEYATLIECKLVDNEFNLFADTVESCEHIRNCYTFNECENCETIQRPTTYNKTLEYAWKKDPQLGVNELMYQTINNNPKLCDSIDFNYLREINKTHREISKQYNKENK
jgi:hypothetical protein